MNHYKNKIGVGVHPERNKLSLEKLENMQLDDLRGIDEHFNPNDLIDEDDEDDQFYLAEYNLQSDKMLKDRQDKQDKRKMEEYGSLVFF